MINQFKKSYLWVRALSLIILLTFSSSSLGFTQSALIDNLTTLNLPLPGTIVTSSKAFVPVLLKGMTIHPENPFKLDFIVDSGNSTLTSDQIQKESERLVKYFMASMTVPKNDLWVNLSPYEKDRIIPEELGKTELGRDLLAQDYILKQLSASLIYPESELGTKFWERVRQQAFEQYGIKNVPMSTFNKVWILPESATVYEHGNNVYIVDSHLKVMLDQDYLALQENQHNTAMGLDQQSDTEKSGASLLTSQMIRELIIPEIEKEINQGKNFAPLRQIYHSLILAKWYKETIKQSLLSQVYVDRSKVAGIELNDLSTKEKIYDRYMEAYKKGVYNYMKEEYDQVSQEVIPRQYFSGGFTDAKIAIERTEDRAQLANSNVGEDYTVAVNVMAKTDQGMLVEPIEEKVEPTASALSLLDLSVADLNKLENEIRLNQIVTELQELYKELLEKAGTDLLTGLPNAWKFAQDAEVMLSKIARARSESMANYILDEENRDQSESPPIEKVHLALLSIDHFKEVNDLFDHQTGDEVLKLFAKGLQQSIRPTDVVARLGGKEFVLLLSDVTDQQAEQIIERIRSNFKASLSEEILQKVPNVGISAGVTSSDDSLILVKKEQRNSAREKLTETAYVGLESAKQERDRTEKNTTNLIPLISDIQDHIKEVDSTSTDPLEKAYLDLQRALQAKREKAPLEESIFTFDDSYAGPVSDMIDADKIKAFEYFKRSIPALNKIAKYDQLTKLYSRIGFQERLISRLAELRRNPSRKISIAMADIDNFGVVNMFGKELADKVLQQVAGAFQDTLRPTDDIGRNGTSSEEILMILETDPVGAQTALNRVATQIQTMSIPELKGATFKATFDKLWKDRMNHPEQKEKLERAVEMQLKLQGKQSAEDLDRWVVTFSAGVTDQTTEIIKKELEKLDLRSPIPQEIFNKIYDELFAYADSALMDAKKTGRNKIAVYNTSDESKDSAQVSDVGGIDMNDIEVTKQGSGASITFDLVDTDSLIKEHIQTFVPVIINVTPLTNLPTFLGLDVKSSNQLKSSMNSKALSNDRCPSVSASESTDGCIGSHEYLAIKS